MSISRIRKYHGRHTRNINPADPLPRCSKPSDYEKHTLARLVIGDKCLAIKCKLAQQQYARYATEGIFTSPDPPKISIYRPWHTIPQTVIRVLLQNWHFPPIWRIRRHILSSYDIAESSSDTPAPCLLLSSPSPRLCLLSKPLACSEGNLWPD